MACAEVEVSLLLRPILELVRRRLVDGFVDAGGGGRRLGSACRYAVEVTLLDPHISESERARGRTLIEAEAEAA